MANTQTYGEPTKYGTPINYGVDFAPEIPNNLRTNIITNSKRPTFWWDSSNDPEGNPVSYEIEIATDTSFENVIFEYTNIPDRPLATIEFQPDEDLELSYGTYYWRVRAWDQVGYSAWSSETSLTGFDYNVSDFLLNIEHYSSPSPTSTARVYGTISDPGSRIRVNGTIYGPFVTANWVIELSLETGINTFVFEGISPAGRISGSVTIDIEYAFYTPRKHHIWNLFDEFGLMLDLPRINTTDYIERNWEYQNRLFDVMFNPPGNDSQGMINGISRELQLRTYSTLQARLFPLTQFPDPARTVTVKINSTQLTSSEFTVLYDSKAIYLVEAPSETSVVLIRYCNKHGDEVVDILKNRLFKKRTLRDLDTPDETHIKIIPLHNEVYQEKLLDRTDSEGHAIDTKLEQFVDLINQKAPITWKRLIWDEASFDVVGKDYLGYNLLPSIWDAKSSDITAEYWKAGIGDQDDLYIKELVTIDG